METKTRAPYFKYGPKHDALIINSVNEHGRKEGLALAAIELEVSIASVTSRYSRELEKKPQAEVKPKDAIERRGNIVNNMFSVALQELEKDQIVLYVNETLNKSQKLSFINRVLRNVVT